MGDSKRNLGRPRQQEHAVPTKVRVLSTAVSLFVEQGYKNVAMDDVALRCNVTKATVYYYYSTKAELFTAAFEALMSRIRNSSMDILSTEEPFEKRLENLVTIFTYATVNIDVDNFIKEATPSLSVDQLLKIEDCKNTMYDGIETCFIREAENGILPKENTKFFTHTFLALLTMSKQRDREGKGFFETPEETAKQVVRFFWAGVQNGK